MNRPRFLDNLSNHVDAFGAYEQLCNDSREPSGQSPSPAGSPGPALTVQSAVGAGASSRDERLDWRWEARKCPLCGGRGGNDTRDGWYECEVCEGVGAEASRSFGRYDVAPAAAGSLGALRGESVPPLSELRAKLESAAMVDGPEDESISLSRRMDIALIAHFLDLRADEFERAVEERDERIAVLEGEVVLLRHEGNVCEQTNEQLKASLTAAHKLIDDLKAELAAKGGV